MAYTTDFVFSATEVNVVTFVRVSLTLNSFACNGRKKSLEVQGTTDTYMTELKIY